MKQITVKEFLKSSLSEQIKYTSVLEHVKAKELISVDLNSLSYNDVKIIFKELKKANCDIEHVFTKALNISKDDFFMLPIQNFFIIKKYIEGFFVNLFENEVKLLQSVDADNGLFELAGGNELNPFSDVLPLSQLCKIYGGYPFEMGEKAYQEIIYLLRMNNIQNRVDRDYQKLKSKQK